MNILKNQNKETEYDSNTNNNNNNNTKQNDFLLKNKDQVVNMGEKNDDEDEDNYHTNNQ